MSQDMQGLFSGANTVVPTTYKQQAYQLIKDAILFRRLKVGGVYSQDGLCAELGISRTPVREALLELQKEGYINFLRGRGIEVVPISRQQAEEIVEMRFIIEVAGAGLAAQRRNEGQLADMRANISEMEANATGEDPVFMYKLDRQFHIHLFQASGNSRMLEAIENLRDQFLRLETLDAFNNAEKSKQVVAEHRAIYEALAAADPERAKAAMQSHLDRTYQRTVKKALDMNTK